MRPFRHGGGEHQKERLLSELLHPSHLRRPGGRTSLSSPEHGEPVSGGLSETRDNEGDIRYPFYIFPCLRVQYTSHHITSYK